MLRGALQAGQLSGCCHYFNRSDQASFRCGLKLDSAQMRCTLCGLMPISSAMVRTLQSVSYRRACDLTHWDSGFARIVNPCFHQFDAGVPQPVLKNHRTGRARRPDPRSGWHGSNALSVPANVSLPPYSPELNPVERVWLYLKERFLSRRLLNDYDAIVTAACNAWNRLLAEAGRIRTLCSYPWIPKVNA